MAMIWKDRVQQTVSAVASSGTGAFTLSTASSGFQALAAGDDGKTGFFMATEGTTWESFWGTYTSSGTSLARTTRIASSSGSAITFTTAATVYLDITQQAAAMMFNATQGQTPGGRLTTQTGVPVSTADRTAQSSLYYTPYVHDQINLWDGNMWTPVTFAEIKVTGADLTGLTSGKPYDVFAYLSSGALALEVLVWTDDTTRATAITIQGGRYCKSGDKTRLYVGSFYTTSTTATEDSAANRYVWNHYNRVKRNASNGVTSSHTYATNTERNWNNSATSTLSNVLIGVADQQVAGFGYSKMGNTTGITGATVLNATVNLRINGTSLSNTTGQIYARIDGGGTLAFYQAVVINNTAYAVAGVNTVILRENNFGTDTGTTFENGLSQVIFQG